MKIKQLSTPVVTDLLIGMSMFHFPRIGNPQTENRVNKKEIERLIKSEYGVAYDETVHQFYKTLLHRFEENRLQSKSILNKEKIKYMQQQDFLSHYTKEELENVLDIIDTVLQENNRSFDNGERLEFYLRILKFLRKDIFALLIDYGLDKTDFIKKFVTVYVTTRTDIYDLCPREQFLSYVIDYLDNEKYTYYVEKVVGTTEAEHLLKIIEIFETYRENGILTSGECTHIILDLIDDYEYESIKMENANALFLKNEGNKYTRNMWGFLLFGLGLISASIYFFF